jgi:hypothetical protein
MGGPEMKRTEWIDGLQWIRRVTAFDRRPSELPDWGWLDATSRATICHGVKRRPPCSDRHGMFNLFGIRRFDRIVNGNLRSHWGVAWRTPSHFEIPPVERSTNIDD